MNAANPDSNVIINAIICDWGVLTDGTRILAGTGTVYFGRDRD